ncbi:hypothetical protein N6H14_09480 [Paenibacillus sp. CC-CFT747]|nr:hypothetical protein N6H14_09480 [Paenibacillus sp. CC-CFT747]
MKQLSWIGPAAAVLIPYGVFEGLKAAGSADPMLVMPRGHFYIVSAVALLALALAVAVGIAGRRLRNGKVGFLALSFISLASIFAVHGLSTPNFMIHASHLPAVSSQLSILLASLWLWLSSLPSDDPFVTFMSRPGRWLLPLWTSVLLLLGGAGLLFPHAVDFIPLDIHPLKGKSPW